MLSLISPTALALAVGALEMWVFNQLQFLLSKTS